MELKRFLQKGEIKSKEMDKLRKKLTYKRKWRMPSFSMSSVVSCHINGNLKKEGPRTLMD